MGLKGMTTWTGLDDIISLLSRRFEVDKEMIVPFMDHVDVISALLGHVVNDSDKLVAGGHVCPDVAIAADRAGLRVEEVLGRSPFVNHAKDVMEVIDSSHTTVYLANPNQVTGSSFSHKDVERLASAVGDGTLILDEKYFDFHGITGLAMLRKYSNIVILRSLTAAFGAGSDGSGFLIGNAGFAHGFREVFDWTRMSHTLHKIVKTALINETARIRRVAMLQDELLRIATRLTELGVQNHITAADFILLRVADTAVVQDKLSRYGVSADNLNEYRGLKNYLRYRMQSPLSNDRLLAAFEHMPTDHFHLDNIDKRTVMFNRTNRDESIDPERANSRMTDRKILTDVLEPTTK
ncbi:MAG: hypothetical protein DRP45_07660 [Candidatus Zixiibacteriota bacterium]|nr:MAG: hypothetical protein DRP45_07660 [candidate division Zixibacteria bacterium]